MLRALHLCYASLEDPLIQTQVVAYLEGLAARGHTIHLLTFEPPLSPDQARRHRADLAARGIAWHHLRYHKRPSLPATVFDVLAGALAASWLVRRHRLAAVHARSHVPAAMGLLVRRLARCALIFDIRGLLGEEYVDAGRWPRDGIAHRLTTRVQGTAIERADAAVVLTERVRAQLFEGRAHPPVTVIPCCADVERLAVPVHRADGPPLMAYVGKLTEPYMDREMAEFLAAARDQDPELSLLLLTQAPPETMLAELDRAGVPRAACRVARCAPEELGAQLAPATFAISFCRPTPARVASSPTKLGEYLGAGLPVVSGPGIGDMDAILEGERVGVVVREFAPAEYERAHAEIRRLAADPETRERCRRVAREVFSLRDVGIPRYDALYREVAARR